MKKLVSAIIISIGFVFFQFNSVYANSPTDCGLTSYVVDGNGVGAIANFVINLSTSLPTYALGTTSGTLNCNGITGIERQEVYVLNTYEKLTEEAAIGEGPYLEALAMMMGCSQQSLSQFNTIVHDHFNELVLGTESTKENAAYFIKGFHAKIKQYPDLMKQCSIDGNA